MYITLMTKGGMCEEKKGCIGEQLALSNACNYCVYEKIVPQYQKHC